MQYSIFRQLWSYPVFTESSVITEFDRFWPVLAESTAWPIRRYARTGLPTGSRSDRPVWAEFQNYAYNALWYFRLGHLSSFRMTSLHSIFSFLNVDNNAICDVCHFAKHKKLPFDSSCNKVDKPFEQMHFDIWTPIDVKSIHSHAYF